jgi:predicted regulator of Ras-like GTPase activity (Roadblock/LC7/MglB family)
MGTIVDHLRMLRDVQGVYGSFVVAGSGSLVDRDLPAAFDEALFADVGPRVARLFETFVSGGKDMDACMLRYAEHKLYVRRMTWGIIGVLSSTAVNLPAQRMVINLVVRRIDPEIGAIASASVRPANTPPPLPVSQSTVKAAIDPGRAASVPSRSQPAPNQSRASVTPSPPRVELVEQPEQPEKPASSAPIRMYRGRPVGD